MAFEKLRTIVITAIPSRDPAKGSASVALYLTFKWWTKFVWRFVLNSSAPAHDLPHITVALKTGKIIENRHGPARDLRAGRQRRAHPRRR